MSLIATKHLVCMSLTQCSNPLVCYASCVCIGTWVCIIPCWIITMNYQNVKVIWHQNYGEFRWVFDWLFYQIVLQVLVLCVDSCYVERYWLGRNGVTRKLGTCWLTTYWVCRTISNSYVDTENFNPAKRTLKKTSFEELNNS